jgi:hypothetical protein
MDLYRFWPVTEPPLWFMLKPIHTTAANTAPVSVVDRDWPVV